MPETVYRQLDPTAGEPIFYQEGRLPSVDPSLFRPTNSDTDGLSLVDAGRRSKVYAAYRESKPDCRNRLIVIPVQRLSAIGEACGFQNFEITHSPDELDTQYGPPFAHCVATSINSVDYQTRDGKRMIKQWMRSVCSAIDSEQWQIEGPFDAPSETDSYRP